MTLAIIVEVVAYDAGVLARASVPVLQCVAVCCSVLQCVVACWQGLVFLCCNVL